MRINLEQGTASAGNARIINLADPVATTDAVTKGYVDTAVAAKQDKLPTVGTAGQVLSLDNNLDPVWATVTASGTITPATVSDIKTGTNLSNPITPGRQDASAFYGLAKAAGDTTQSSSANAVGLYTDAAKASIRGMVDADKE